MQTTIIKCNPGEHRGRLRGYTITVIRDGQRTPINVIAKTGRDAMERVRYLLGDACHKVAA